jgi:hypothetical protein
MGLVTRRCTHTHVCVQEHGQLVVALNMAVALGCVNEVRHPCCHVLPCNANEGGGGDDVGRTVVNREKPRGTRRGACVCVEGGGAAGKGVVSTPNLKPRYPPRSRSQTCLAQTAQTGRCCPPHWCGMYHHTRRCEQTGWGRGRRGRLRARRAATILVADSTVTGHTHGKRSPAGQWCGLPAEGPVATGPPAP